MVGPRTPSLPICGTHKPKLPHFLRRPITDVGNIVENVEAVDRRNIFAFLDWDLLLLFPRDLAWRHVSWDDFISGRSIILARSAVRADLSPSDKEYWTPYILVFLWLWKIWILTVRGEKLQFWELISVGYKISKRHLPTLWHVLVAMDVQPGGPGTVWCVTVGSEV